MATEKDPRKASGSRLVLLSGVMGLAVTAALALARVFLGGGTALRLAVAAAAAVLLAGALERRHVLIATLVSAAGLLVAIGLLVFPSTTRFGLPLGSTLHQIVQSLHQVGRAAETEIAPAFPRPPLVLAALTAVWAAAFACHALAVRAKSPFQALLPPAALLGFTNLILTDAGRPLEVIAFLASALAVLFADEAWRVGQWGAVTAWGHWSWSKAMTGPSGRSARRVGLACLAIALIAPWILPGFRAKGLVSTKAQQRGAGVTVDPFVDIRPQLQIQNPIQLFHVQTNLPTYWRLLALDSFDGEVWRASNPDASNGLRVSQGPLNVPASGSLFLPINQQIYIDRLQGTYLPAAFDPTYITLPHGDIRYDNNSSMLFYPAGLDRNLSYSVSSREPVPTGDQLNLFQSLAPASPATMRYTELPNFPSDVAQKLQAIAHRLTDNQSTPFLKVIAIQDYLHTFRYDLSVLPAASGSQLLDFLTKKKAGYCVQFSASMAVLLRELGIPSRVAVGYTQGTVDPKNPNVYRVTTSDAHAWTEVLFPGFGWIPFEPTPTRSNPGAGSYVFGLTHSLSGSPPPGGSNSTGASPGTSPGAQNPAERNAGRNGTGIGATHQPHSWRWWAFRAFLLLAAMVVIAIPPVKFLARRLAVSRAHRPRDVVLSAYRVMASEAADLGLGRQPHETLWEFRSRLKEEVVGLDGELDRLIGLTGRAAYSDRSISTDQAGRAAAAARLASKQLRRSTPGWKRVSGWFRVDRGSLTRTGSN